MSLNTWLWRDDHNGIVSEKCDSVDAFFEQYGIDIYMASVEMDPYKVKEDYRDELCLYDALDVKHVLPAYSLPVK